MSTLKFAVNTPVRVALAYPTGKEVQGQYGPQVMYTLSEAPAGATAMYLPPLVSDKILALKPQKGEPIQIVKTQKPGSKQMEWQVTRLQPEPVPVRKPVATAPVNGHASANGVPYLDLKTELVRAYDMAIDVLVEARSHAAVAGLPIQFNGEDVRQLAAVVIIDQGKDRRSNGFHQAA